MSKKAFNKILIAAFLITIIALCYREFIRSFNDIKAQSINSKTVNMTKSLETENIGGTNYTQQHTRLDQQQGGLGQWISIKRKDSYNNELQYYSKDNVVIRGNTIAITSKKETKANKMYTSGLVESTNAYKYGYFEFIIEISEGKGLFPAIWFLPDEGGALPEIDLFEMIGSEPYIFYGVIHYIENDKQDFDYFKYEVPIQEKYSVALEWKPDCLTWYIDNEKIYTSKQAVPQEFMFIIVNQAIGGNWPGSPDETVVFPKQFKVFAKEIDPEFKKSR